MPLFASVGALVFAGLVASVADLAGNANTRWFTRRVFAVIALHAMGVTLSGLASWAGDAWSLLPI